MARGPQGQKRPADVIGTTVKDRPAPAYKMSD
jgi:hypothetical protein